MLHCRLLLNDKKERKKERKKEKERLFVTGRVGPGRAGPGRV